MRPGQDLVVGGHIGLEGTACAAREREAVLRKTLPKDLLDAAKGFCCNPEGWPEQAVAAAGGRLFAEKVGEGGIYAALWRMAERHRAGLAVYLRQIPVRQETIEICEALELNPYGLLSGGCVLFAADNGNDIVRLLAEAGICGAVVGKVTGGRDRLIINGETRGYLNRPAPDEIRKITGIGEGEGRGMDMSFCPMNIVLMEPEMPANTGNIGRTCVATGSRLHLIRPLGFLINEKAVKRAGLDYWDRLDVSVYDCYRDFLEKNPQAAGKLYMASTKAPKVYTQVSYEPGAYLMFGKESAGLPEELLAAHRETTVRIPMLPDIRSLNLANSVAIVLYEALRQNRFAHMQFTGEPRSFSWD